MTETILPPAPKSDRNLNRRTLLKASAWSVPAVALSVAAPAAAASTLADLRVGLDQGWTLYASGTLSIATQWEDTYDTLLALNPGDAAAPIGTLNRTLYDNWVEQLDITSTQLWDIEDYDPSDEVALTSASAQFDYSAFRVQSWGTVNAGTVIQATASAPGWVLAGTPRDASGPTVTPGATLIATRTVPSTLSGSARTVMSFVDLTATAAPSIPITVQAVADYWWTNQSNLLPSGVVTVLTPNSNPLGDSAILPITTSLSGPYEFYYGVQALRNLVYDHNLNVQYEIDYPGMSGFPANDGDLVDLDAILAARLYDVDLLPQ